MDKDNLIKIAEDAENKSNKDLANVSQELKLEFDKTKDLIISLTRHLDVITELYNKVSIELNNRVRK